MKKILAIDGGGIRGIVPGQVLIALEQKLQAKSGNPDARLADFFDFFAGTSTGGILSSLYLCPAADNPGKARFSAQQAVNLYVENGGKIFSASTWKRLESGNGILDEKYDAAELEKALRSYLGDLRLSQLRRPCIVPAYDIQNRRAHFFAQHNPALQGPGYDFLVRDVCRATSAAPTYFETALVKSLTNEAYALVDGGVFANNPALSAYSEVRNAQGNPTAQDMFIVSLGTGGKNEPYPYEAAKDWGAAGWVRPLIDIMMDGASETTDYHLSRVFSASGRSDQYVRVQPADLGAASPAIDNASPANIQALVQLGAETARKFDVQLERIATTLLADGPDPVQFAAPVAAH